MINLINEINSKLKAIISELETKKNECEKVLDEVKSKIDKKIDEAKGYKVDVDSAKDKIKTLEEEIKALEVDLTDLNERFGKKDLNAIVEAGNKEINAKMIAKQNEITKYREKIGELTEKARAIKDLLINLKKDKEKGGWHRITKLIGSVQPAGDAAGHDRQDRLGADVTRPGQGFRDEERRSASEVLCP